MVEASSGAGNIRVAIRVRPLLEHEVKAGHGSSMMKVNTDDGNIQLHIPDKEKADKYSTR
jgi:hypothetical protein